MGMKEFLAKQKKKAALAKANGQDQVKEKFRATPGHIADPAVQADVDKWPDLPAFPFDLYPEGVVDDKVVEAEGRLLGQGEFGQVIKSVNKSSGNEVAIKRIRWTGPKMEQTVRMEDKLTKAVEHRNIIQCHGLFCDERFLFLILELCRGKHLGASSGDVNDGFLSEVLEAGEPAVKFILSQVLDALILLHDLHIGHLDLKLENIMVAEPGTDPMSSTYKLVDFGLSKELETPRVGMFGTPNLCPPEMFAKEEFGVAADMWQLGCVTFKLVCGELPYHGNRDVLVEAVMNKPVAFEGEVWDKVSDECKDFISKLLVKDQAGRMTSKQAREHPWLKSS